MPIAKLNKEATVLKYNTYVLICQRQINVECLKKKKIITKRQQQKQHNKRVT